MGKHERLKDFRKYVKDECDKNPQVKAAVGDIRRMIKSRLNTISANKASNMAAVSFLL